MAEFVTEDVCPINVTDRTSNTSLLDEKDKVDIVDSVTSSPDTADQSPESPADICDNSGSGTPTNSTNSSYSSSGSHLTSPEHLAHISSSPPPPSTLSQKKDCGKLTGDLGLDGLSVSSSSISGGCENNGIAALNQGIGKVEDSTGTTWPNSFSDYELKEIIGVGATAVVNSAICIANGRECAIKRINLEKWNTSMDELLKEIQAMNSCSHENVVNYFTSFVHKDELWLVLGLLNAGSLLDIIRHTMKNQNCHHGVFDESTIATVLRDVLKGLEYLHSTGHIHRDIKAGNILLGSNGQVQIADFGVSAWLMGGSASGVDRSRSRHTFVGTPCWMAPEVMEQVIGYNHKADIWSFGITAIELATGTAPYHKYPPMKVLMLTLQNEPPTLDSGADEKDQFKQYGKTFRKMISECLQKEPSKRPSAAELLKHPFFKHKAKDRKFLQTHLVPSAPSIESRIEKARSLSRAPGTSGRLHRNPTTGDWAWSDDEATNSCCSQDDYSQDCSSNISDVKSNGDEIIDLVLRMRNPRRELNDIRFEFRRSVDTSDGIATELLSTGLILQEDVKSISNSIQKFVDWANAGLSNKLQETVTFRIHTGFRPDQDTPDEKTLTGFAHISLASNAAVKSASSSNSEVS